MSQVAISSDVQPRANMRLNIGICDGDVINPSSASPGMIRGNDASLNFPLVAHVLYHGMPLHYYGIVPASKHDCFCKQISAWKSVFWEVFGDVLLLVIGGI